MTDSYAALIWYTEHALATAADAIDYFAEPHTI